MRDETGTCTECGSGPEQMHADECSSRGAPPPLLGPGVNLPLHTGFIAVPGGSPTPATPGAAYGPLTADEREQVAYLRTALSGLDETLSLEPMRVVHDGYPRVALVAVKHAGDEVLATPLALLIDPALFEAMGTPQPEMKGPVQKDDDPEPLLCDDPDPEHVCDDGSCCECGGAHCCGYSECPVQVDMRPNS